VEREYHPLRLRELGGGARYHRPAQSQAARVTPESAAAEVMTDLSRVSPATIRPDAPLDGANRFMIARGVRLLLVVHESQETVLGVLTATDLLGERPMLAATARGVPRDELTVADIMTPAAEVEVVELADVQASRVGHVVETLRRAGRQHALVIDAASMVRGIFSLSQIARQLGVAVPAAGETALTFSQIEAALAK
jgi:CBS domain containing-hemolysin-like protein